MRVVCTGGRDYTDGVKVHSVLTPLANAGYLEVIVGDARGLDTLVVDWCRYEDIDCEVFYADWNKHGKPAGHIRNGEMLATKPNFVIAFPGGRGTANCVMQARKLGIPVREVN